MKLVRIITFEFCISHIVAKNTNSEMENEWEHFCHRLPATTYFLLEII